MKTSRMMLAIAKRGKLSLPNPELHLLAVHLPPGKAFKPEQNEQMRSLKVTEGGLAPLFRKLF